MLAKFYFCLVSLKSEPTGREVDLKPTEFDPVVPLLDSLANDMALVRCLFVTYKACIFC